MNASCCDDRVRSARRAACAPASAKNVCAVDSARRLGFSLVELLVVIGIITLLVSILVPSLRKAKVMAKQINCLSNTRTIGHALLAYANSNDGYLPAVRRDEALDYTTQAYAPPDGDWEGGPEGVGLLHEGKYQKGPDAYYCPGRDTGSDPFAIRNRAEDWRTPMSRDRTDSENYSRTSYFVATSSYRTGDNSMDYSRWHRIETTHPTKALAFEACVQFKGKPYGTSGHRHEEGYNFIFFDGNGRWVPDVRKVDDGSGTRRKTVRNELETNYDLDSVLPWEDNDTNLIHFIMTRYFAWSSHHKHHVEK